MSLFRNCRRDFHLDEWPTLKAGLLWGIVIWSVTITFVVFTIDIIGPIPFLWGASLLALIVLYVMLREQFLTVIGNFWDRFDDSVPESVSFPESPDEWQRRSRITQLKEWCGIVWYFKYPVLCVAAVGFSLIYYFKWTGVGISIGLLIFLWIGGGTVGDALEKAGIDDSQESQ